MAFEGFPDEGKFFRALAKHQNRDWFQAHKAEFEEGWQTPMAELLAAVRERIDGSFPHCDLGDARIFRIYRDVRFSKDKSPYKTNIGGIIPVQRAGRTTEVPIALYFHVGLPRAFGASGHYMMDPHSLERFRRAVADAKRGKELDKLLAGLRKKGFTVESHDTFKRVPKGYDPNHPRAEHLKRKGLTVGFPAIPKGLLTKPKLTPWLAAQASAAAPLVEWLVFATA